MSGFPADPLRRPYEKARPRGVADPLANADLRRLMVELSRAAQVFASGRDGISMVPSDMRAEVHRWRGELSRRGLILDHERWLLGLVTLARLPRARETALERTPGERAR
jgi:hypothetical protein